MWKRTRFLLLILPQFHHFSFSPIFKYKKKIIFLFSGTESHTKLNLGLHMNSGLMYHVYLNQAAGVYLFLYFLNFLSNSKTLNFWLHFSVRPTKLKLDTHMGKGLFYCVYQIQAARIYLFLCFSSFFRLPNWQRLKTCIYKIVSTNLWWLRPGVCELCSLSAIFPYVWADREGSGNGKTLWVHRLAWTFGICLCVRNHFHMDRLILTILDVFFHHHHHHKLNNVQRSKINSSLVSSVVKCLVQNMLLLHTRKWITQTKRTLINDIRLDLVSHKRYLSHVDADQTSSVASDQGLHC